MPSIVAYRKYIDANITRELRLPQDPINDHAQAGATELATIDGITYVCLPDGVTIPGDQPHEIAATISYPVVLTDELIQQIRAANPRVKLIDQLRQDQIRSRYSLDDEFYLARISIGMTMGAYTPSAKELAMISDYQAWVEGCRNWAKAERAKLGL